MARLTRQNNGTYEIYDGEKLITKGVLLSKVLLKASKYFKGQGK